MLTYSGGRSGRFGPSTWYLITYESRPFDFISVFAVHATMAAFGLALCVGQCWLIRNWWRNKPKPPSQLAAGK
jgi:hypothetical protein